MKNNQLLEEFSERYKQVIDIVTPCMDNYLYIMDFQRDTYWISLSALDRFAIPSNFLEDATREIKEFTHPDDYSLLLEDIACIMRKEKDFHSLQYRWMDRAGRTVWINCRGRVLFDEQGEPKYMVGCINEIGKKQKADNVSGLLGDFVLEKELQNIAGDKKTGYLLRIGIDNFKEINENKGISYGDTVLMKTAEAIGKAISGSQKLFKIMGDEFVVVDFDDTMRENVSVLYNSIRDRIKEYIEENDYEVFFTVSAGILFFSDVEEQSYENFMKFSEFALNEAKDGGRNKCCIYDAGDYAAFLRRRDLLRTLRLAVINDFEGFEVYFQPVVDINSNRIYGAESLLRFKTGQDFVYPFEFIPLLEESGLIIPVGKWVLEQAAKACCQIQKAIPDFRISVNISYIQVLKSDVLDDIVATLEKFGLDYGSIMVELTESGFFEDDDNFIRFCHGLKEYGVPLALDDFGTGYSNFHYLYRLSPNVIKIDRSFTLKALKNEYEYNLLKYMADMTHNINLNFCIEGIETKEELEKICTINPDYIQGYYFGKPSPFGQFMKDHVEP